MSCWRLVGSRWHLGRRLAVRVTVAGLNPPDAIARLLDIWPTFWPEVSPVELHPVKVHRTKRGQ